MSECKQMFARHSLVRGSRHASCEDGWLPLIEGCLTKLEAFGVPVEIRRIREKMGCLRLDIATPCGLSKEDKIRWEDIIRSAEEAALTTCEVCGSPARLRVSETGTYATRCEQHEVI